MQYFNGSFYIKGTVILCRRSQTSEGFFSFSFLLFFFKTTGNHETSSKKKKRSQGLVSLPLKGRGVPINKHRQRFSVDHKTKPGSRGTVTATVPLGPVASKTGSGRDGIKEGVS